MNFTVTTFQGKGILNWVDLIANLRVTEFEKFPYLYAGNFDIEKKYLAAYAKDEHSYLLGKIANLVINKKIMTSATIQSPLQNKFLITGITKEDAKKFIDFLK